MHRRLGYGPGLLASQLAKAMLGRRAASAWRARHSEKGWSVLAADFLRDHKDDLPEVGMVGAGRNLDNHLRSQLLHYGFGQILHYEDQSSMSHGIEIRSPFIDHRLMAFAFGLPSADKLSDGITKRILRCAFAHRLPGCIVNNHQKIGFATPFEEWSRQPAFRDFVRDIVHSDEFRNRRVWNAARLSARLLDPASVARGFPVWRFIQAELWFRSCGITNV